MHHWLAAAAQQPAAPFIQQFMLSPGLGGLAAIAAAVVAIVTVNRRISADRTMAKEAREETLATAERVRANAQADAERIRVDALAAAAALRANEAADRAAEQWWEMYTWTLNRLETLPVPRVTLLVEELERHVKTDIEAAFLTTAARMMNIGPNGEEGQER